MAKTSGASHAMAAFFSIVLSGMVSDFLGTYASAFSGLGRTIGTSVTNGLGVSLPAETTGHLLIATGLAFAWGIVYHYARHETDAGSSESVEPTSTPDPDTTDVPDELVGIVTEGYANNAHIADENVQTHIENVLGNEISPRLDDAQDRLVADGNRDGAEEIKSIITDVKGIERSLSPSLGENVTDSHRRESLRNTHVNLVTAAADLRTCADSILSSVRDGEPELGIDEFHQQYEIFLDAHEARQRIIEQVSNHS